jgi:hypothetical protein
MKDLFGNECTEKDFEPRPKTMIERGLRRYRYRKRESDEKCCKTCMRHIKRNDRFYKCELVGCTMSAASDIRAFNVCDAWERRS